MRSSIALQVDDVCTYVGKTVLVNNATFDVKAGEIIGLIGPNGAGKTTIMKTILGLMKFKGKIEVNGKNVSENDHHALTSVGALIEHYEMDPFNMVDLTRQYGNYGMYVLTTHLNNQELLIGSLIYILIFVIAGYLIFRRKRF